MSWEFSLVPQDAFSPEALEEMRTFLRSHPSYVRSDGLIVVRPDDEYVQIVMRTEGAVDAPPRPNSLWFKLAPNGAICGVYGPDPLNKVTAQFVRFCQSRWPCSFRDEVGKDVAIERFEAWSTQDSN